MHAHNATNAVCAGKRVYNGKNFDPSVNHLIMVRTEGVANQSIDTAVNDDLHEVTTAEGVGAIGYVMWAGEVQGTYESGTSFSSGRRYDDSVFQEMFDTITGGCSALRPPYPSQPPLPPAAPSPPSSPPPPPPHECEGLQLTVDDPSEMSGAWKRNADSFNGRPAYTHATDNSVSSYLHYESLAAYHADDTSANWGAGELCGSDCWTIGWDSHHRFYLVTTLNISDLAGETWTCLLYTSPSPRDRQKSRMPSSA